jgi:hypothetical protein
MPPPSTIVPISRRTIHPWRARKSRWKAVMTKSTDQPCIHTLNAMAIGPREPSVPGGGLKSELTDINHDHHADSPHDCVEVSEDSFPASDPPSWIPIIGIG